jgi:heme-degrading monooxygenase HmoA
MPLVSVTRLRIRSWRYMPGFAFYAVQTNVQARRAAGNRGMKLLNEPGRIFWTATVWESEAAVKQYMTSGAHGKAMRHLVDWCDEASVVRWEQESAAMPMWQEAYRRMMSEGRRSKVRYPSAAQERFEVPPPRT